MSSSLNVPQDEGSSGDTDSSDEDDDDATKDHSHTEPKAVLGKRKAKAPIKSPPRKKSEKPRSAFVLLIVCLSNDAEPPHRRTEGGDRVRARAREHTYHPILTFKLVVFSCPRSRLARVTSWVESSLQVSSLSPLKSPPWYLFPVGGQQRRLV